MEFAGEAAEFGDPVQFEFGSGEVVGRRLHPHALKQRGEGAAEELLHQRTGVGGRELQLLRKIRQSDRFGQARLQKVADPRAAEVRSVRQQAAGEEAVEYPVGAELPQKKQYRFLRRIRRRHETASLLHAPRKNIP